MVNRPIKNDISGNKYGRLTVIGFSYDQHNWKCICDCGNIKMIGSWDLTHGYVKSCGCLKKELLSKRLTTHNMSGTRLYNIWTGTKSRCYNQRYEAHKNYGTRGITVCDEWKNNFMSFYNWAINNGYRDDLTLDRINNNGDYEPSNCRWVTIGEQADNRRNSRRITYGRKTQTLKQWSNELGLDYKLLYNRLYKLKWSVEKSFVTQPKKAKGGQNV